MTREEAIARLKLDRDLCNFNPMTGEKEPMNEDCRKLAEALDIAIKALEKEPCEDAISRKSMLDYLNYLHGEMPEEEFVKALPSITPTRKKWNWIFTKTVLDKYGSTVECPSCHKKWKTYDEIRFEKENRYCPNCGAEMEGTE